MESEGRGLSAELKSGWLDSAQCFSFIALRQYLQRYGFDSSSIRYRTTASLSHPAGEVSAAWLKEINGESKVTVDVSLMGLYGTTSPLPAFYTERILGLDLKGGDEREKGGAFAESEYDEGVDLKQFYDLFNHQAISLFYDAWNKYRITSRFTEYLEGGEGKGCQMQPAGEFATALLSIWGIDRQRLASFKHLTLSRLMPLAGLLASRCSSIDMLDQALNRCFGDVTITTQSLVPGVVDVPQDQLNCLGRNNVTLGESLVLGQKVADCSSIVVTVKLNSPGLLDQWLSGGEQNESARELISLILDGPNDYQMILNIGEPFKGLSEIGRSNVDGTAFDSTHRRLGLGVGLGEMRNAVINV